MNEKQALDIDWSLQTRSEVKNLDLMEDAESIVYVNATQKGCETVEKFIGDVEVEHVPDTEYKTKEELETSKLLAEMEHLNNQMEAQSIKFKSNYNYSNSIPNKNGDIFKNCTIQSSDWKWGSSIKHENLYANELSYDKPKTIKGWIIVYWHCETANKVEALKKAKSMFDGKTPLGWELICVDTKEETRIEKLEF